MVKLIWWISYSLCFSQFCSSISDGDTLIKKSLYLLDLISGLGYSFDFNSTENGKGKTYSGINFNAGINYSFTEKIFLHLQYDFIKYNKSELVYYNENLSLVKLGIGIKI